MDDLLILGSIGFLGFACQMLAWRTRIPAILFYLLVGIGLGPVAGILNPDQLLGNMLIPLVSLAVAIILFEGSLTLRFTELRDVGSTVVRNMVTWAALIEAVLITLICHYAIGLPLPLSALFGALMIVTGPTVIIPMLNSVRPNSKVAKVLRWEGVVIDPLGSLFAVLVYEWIVAQHSHQDIGHVFRIFFETVAVGGLCGLVTGYLLGICLRFHWIPEHLQNFAVVATVAVVFAISNSLMHESGLLAVTIMGICLANMKELHIRDILNFKENLSQILVSVLFITLAARVDLSSLLHLGIGALWMLLLMQCVARPFKVFLSTLGSSFKPGERFLIGWIGPRGIVAAAVSAVFAMKLEQLQVERADILVPMTFTIIIGTVVIQSATARPIARFLGVSEPDNSGFLIIGANRVAVLIGEALETAGIHCILCDSHWENISNARMKGLTVYHGDPSSEHADINLELSGIGGMLGLSRYRGDNTTAALRFREDFGIQNIFMLASPEDERATTKHSLSRHYKGNLLFGEQLNFRVIERMVNQGYQIKRTQLSDEYSYEAWQDDHQNDATVLLFALDRSKNLHLVTTGKGIHAEAGWTLFSLYRPDETKRSKKQQFTHAPAPGDLPG